MKLKWIAILMTGLVLTGCQSKDDNYNSKTEDKIIQTVMNVDQISKFNLVGIVEGNLSTLKYNDQNISWEGNVDEEDGIAKYQFTIKIGDILTFGEMILGSEEEVNNEVTTTFQLDFLVNETSLTGTISRSVYTFETHRELKDELNLKFGNKRIFGEIVKNKVYEIADYDITYGSTVIYGTQAEHKGASYYDLHFGNNEFIGKQVAKGKEVRYYFQSQLTEEEMFLYLILEFYRSVVNQIIK